MSDSPYGAGSGSLVLRPRHIPTDESHAYVRKMVAYGLPFEQVAQVLDISLEDLHRLYQRDLDLGKAELVMEVGTQVNLAAKDRKHPQFFQCASFILRSQGGWRDVRAVENTTKDLPEEQKQKLIDQLTERILAEKLKEKVPA